MRALEVNHYPGIRGAAELLFTTAFGMGCILLTSIFYSILPSISLLSYFIYIWYTHTSTPAISVHSQANTSNILSPLTDISPLACSVCPPPAGVARIRTSRS